MAKAKYIAFIRITPWNSLILWKQVCKVIQKRSVHILLQKKKPKTHNQANQYFKARTNSVSNIMSSWFVPLWLVKTFLRIQMYQGLPPSKIKQWELLPCVCWDNVGFLLVLDVSENLIIKVLIS